MSPLTVLSVENADAFAGFVSSLFDLKPSAILQLAAPLRYSVINVQENTSLILIPKENATLFKNCIQNHILFVVPDLKSFQQRATKLGGLFVLSNHDDCMFYGPEKIIFHLISSKASLPIHEVLVSSLKAEDIPLQETSHRDPPSSKLGKIPTPINTVKVEILSHNSERFAPLLPNSFEPIPFETDVRTSSPLISCNNPF